jgi:hypothetical protein
LLDRIAERQAAAPGAKLPDHELSDPLDDLLPPEPAAAADELTIPGFLARTPNAADEAAKAEIIAQQKDAKKQKAVARKAKANDGLAKKPLMGKAALAAIKG